MLSCTAGAGPQELKLLLDLAGRGPIGFCTSAGLAPAKNTEAQGMRVAGSRKCAGNGTGMLCACCSGIEGKLTATVD